MWLGGLADAVPTATTCQLEGAGHAAPFDAPAGFAQLVADALSVPGREVATR